MHLTPSNLSHLRVNKFDLLIYCIYTMIYAVHYSAMQCQNIMRTTLIVFIGSRIFCTL